MKSEKWFISTEETNEGLQNEEIHHKEDDQNPVSTDNVVCIPFLFH